MKRIFSQIFSLRNNYVNPASASAIQSAEVPSTRHITIGRGQRSSGPAPAPSPVASSVPLTSPNFNSTYFNYQLKPEVDLEVEIPSQLTDESESYYYSTLLNSAADMASKNKPWLISQLSLKRVLSKNQEMKKIILKVAAMALSNENGQFNNAMASLHPFIPTAGEVFFGATNNNEEVDETSETVQDILTPGLLILLLDKLVKGNSIPLLINQLNHGISSRHLLLAKALVETSAGYLIHRTIQETNHLNEDNHSHETLHQGNKLATLTGDLLVVSVIKNVASIRNNQVLELTMNSLSEFSTTEVARSQKPFQNPNQASNKNNNVYKALLPKALAESIVLSQGFKSAVILSGVKDKAVQDWAAKLGSLTGLLWKTNFDYQKLHSNGGKVENISEFNAYLTEIREKSARLLNVQHPGLNKDVITVLKELLSFWSTNKRNQLHA